MRRGKSTPPAFHVENHYQMLSQGSLEQFFNDTDNQSSIGKHNNHLAHMFTDATLATVHEVLQSLQKVESRLAANSDLNIRAGDTDGKGGYGGHTGGQGGLEKAARLAIKIVDRFRQIHGGTGGEGRLGDVIGGRGETDQGPKLSPQLLSVDEKDLPPLSVAEFFQEYKLSDKIYKLLDGQGFETVGALFRYRLERRLF
ncbi:hypothetical protein B0H19DRAFT_1057194 [Mycena capillaripes]|nr:hypothetical protein B0H19DRAFT_1057194 [Mycena capillaripes]